MQITPLKSKTLHVRSGNGYNKFSYSFLSYLISFNDENIKKPWWLTVNALGLFSVNERDYFRVGDLNTSLKKRLEDYLDLEIKSFSLLCGGRFLNYIFNPVSFYFIESMNGERKVVVEIWNTFGEFKPVVIDEVEGLYNFNFKKNFYISPFMPMDSEILIDLKQPETYSGLIKIISIKNNQKIYADWKFEKLGKSLILLFPYSFKVSFAIHYQALRIFLKRVRFYKKSEDQDKQTGFFLWNK